MRQVRLPLAGSSIRCGEKGIPPCFSPPLVMACGQNSSQAVAFPILETHR